MPAPDFFIDLLVAFNLGLASQVHCVGMCGGIVASMTLGLSPAVQKNPTRLAAYALTYNLGRITSYMVAGSLAGLLAARAAGQLPALAGHGVLRWLAAAVLVLAGLALLRQSRGLSSLERLGMKLWAYIAPFGRRLLPIRSLSRAFLFGLLWGGLPCALVYSTLMFAAASGSVTRAAAVMLVFGLGTLPAVLATSWFASRAGHGLRSATMRRFAGGLLIVVGLTYPWLGQLSHQGHAGHQAHQHAMP